MKSTATTTNTKGLSKSSRHYPVPSTTQKSTRTRRHRAAKVSSLPITIRLLTKSPKTFPHLQVLRPRTFQRWRFSSTSNNSVAHSCFHLHLYFCWLQVDFCIEERMEASCLVQRFQEDDILGSLSFTFESSTFVKAKGREPGVAGTDWQLAWLGSVWWASASTDRMSLSTTDISLSNAHEPTFRLSYRDKLCNGWKKVPTGRDYLTSLYQPYKKCARSWEVMTE